MTKLRKAWLAILTVIALICASLVTLTLVGGGGSSSDNHLNNGSGNSAGIVIPNNSASATAGALSDTSSTSFESLDGTYVIKAGTTNAQKAAVWDEAIKNTSSNTRTVLVRFEDDWTASSSGDFGTAADSSNGAKYLFIPSNIKMVLDLNGHTLNRNLLGGAAIPQGNVLWILGTLDIRGGGTITGTNTQNCGAVNAKPGSTLILNGVTVTGNKAGGGAGVYSSGGKITINDATITYNETVSSWASNNWVGGGGVGVSNGGSITMNGGLIDNNTAIFGGGLALCGGATFTMNGGVISNNTATSDGGGGVVLQGGSAGSCSFTMNGGSIDNNKTTGGLGGGVLSWGYSTFTMNGGQIYKNEAAHAGGGIAIDAGSSGSATVTINGGSIIQNKSASGKSGGGIVLLSDTLNVNGGFISGNEAGGNGGGIHVGAGTATFKGGTVTGNKAPSGNGAGICLGVNANLQGGLKCMGNVGGQNLYVCTGKKLNVSGNVAGAYIGVTMQTPTISGGNAFSAAFTSGWSGASYGRCPLYFFSDSASYVAACSYDTATNGECALTTIASAGNGYYTIQWQYKLDGDATYRLAGSGIETLSYSGKKVVDVRAVITPGTDPAVTQGISDMHSVSDSRDSAVNKTSGLGNETGVGELNFICDLNTADINGYFPATTGAPATFTIKIEPIAAAVTINNCTAVYGTDPTYTFSATGLVGGDTVNDLNVTVGRSYGADVGTYTIFGTGWNNENYKVTFTSGELTVTQRDVYVIINNDEADYGKTNDMNTEITSTENNTPDADGKYVGGWRYGTKPDGSASDHFHPSDITTSSSPFKLTSTEIKTAETAASSGYAPVKYDSAVTDNTTQTGKKVVGYNIIEDTASTNANYNIHFIRWDEEANGGAGGEDKTKTYGTFTVKEAEITVGKDATSNDYQEDIAFASLPTGGKKADITGTITLKGDTTATATKTWLEQPDLTANPSWVAPDEKNFHDTTVYTWQALSAMPAKTAAGTYTFYFKVSAPNHAIKIQKWILKITADGLTYSFKIETVKGTTKTDITSTAESSYEKDTTVVVSATKTDGTALPTDAKYTVYYKGTGTTEYGVWDAAVDQNTADADDKISIVDSNLHKDYGTKTAPKNAGTYQAQLVEASDSNYALTNDGGSNIKSFTIKKQQITTPPSRKTTNALTYTGSAQPFEIKDFDNDIMEYIAAEDYITPATDVKEKLDSTKFTAADNWTLEGTNAYDYLAGFKLKDTDNYEWDTSLASNLKTYTDTGVTPNKTYVIYELKLTLNKKKLEVEFTSPQKNADPSKNNSWSWEPADYASGGEISYTIKSSCIVNSENVTVSLIYADKPASGALAENAWQNVTGDKLTAGNNFEIKSLTKGKYYVSVKLTNDTGDDDVNKNYTIERDDTTGKYKNCTQEFEVTDGTASVTSVAWQYEFMLNTTKTTEDLDGATIKYQRNNKASNYLPVEYTLSVKGDDLADYLEIKTDYTGTTGKGGEPGDWASGYKNAKQTNASTKKVSGDYNKYVTWVALHIKDKDDEGNAIEIVFEATSTDYVYIDDKTCEVKVEWVIEKGTLDLSDLLEWGFTVGTDTTVHEFREVPKKDGSGNKIQAVDGEGNPLTDDNGDPIYVTRSETDAQGLKAITPVVKSLDIPATVATAKTPSGHGYGSSTVNKNNIGSTLTTTVSFTLVDTNYEQPNAVTLEWAVTDATVDITGWDDNGKVTVGGKTYGSPVVEGTDKDIADKVEYVYEYGGVTKTIKDLWDLADANLAGGGTGRLSNVKVTVKAKSGYQLTSSNGTDFEYTIPEFGYTGTPVSVKADKTEGTYGEAAIKLTLTAAGGDDVTNEPDLYEVKVYDNDGKELGVLGSADATLSKLPAGKYKIVVTTLIAGYTIKPGEGEITFTVKPVELDLPVLTSNPVFTGGDITVEKLLDENTLKYLKAELITVGGQGAEGSAFRDTGTVYTLVITIKDSRNYVWAGSDGDKKVATKFMLTAADSKPETTKESDSVATIDWEIMPYVIAVKESDWNLSGKKGPKLNIGIPAGMEAEIGYNYYDARTGGASIESLSAGSSAWVSAVLTGADVDKYNIVFADSGTNETAARVNYTMPKGGMAAFASGAMNFLKANWLWLVIALAILLFLIILICLIKHRKKTKEIREEKKAKKEEEKQRKEDEKRRREEEREAARAKQQAELELQKAKQEAELAKMRAGLGLGAGAAGMAMAAQQPAQQPMPQQQPMQPQMQQMPMQQQYPQMPQYQQPMMQMPMPQQYPQYPQYGEERMRALEDRLSREAEERARRADERALRAAEDRARMAEERAMRAEFNTRQYTQFVPQSEGGNPGSIPMDVLGALVVSALKNMANGTPKIEEPKAELPQKVEETSGATVSTPTVYPPDAVITTTTTVDTTKSKSEPVSRDGERNFDIDGFYDTFDINNK